jgi:hypothetical protein
MLRMIGNALLSIVMEKKAIDKLEERRGAATRSTREIQVDGLRDTVGRVMTPERQELIRKAMEVQRAKSQIFDDLKDVDKQRLYALAVKKLLREGRETDDEKK